MLVRRSLVLLGVMAGVCAVAQTTPGGPATALGGFVGFWKPDCKLPFGVQIVPTTRPALGVVEAAAPRYALNFCGPGGCATQQEYRPDSPIVGDASIQVVSARQLRVQGRDGWSDLYKCSDNPDAVPQTLTPGPGR
jgi:hypothetical protein